MTVAYIGLGSNLGRPRQQISAALDALAQLPDTRLDRYSDFYRSAAIGPTGQPDYLNAVARLHTALEPVQLLARLHSIENAQGRERSVRWGPRTLDLDILLYGELILDSADLQIPHPRLAERNFVLYPLYDISPGLRLPNGTPLGALLASIDGAGLARLEPTHDDTSDRAQREAEATR